VLVVEVSLAEAGRTHLWSMTCCVRREVRSQAVRERRSRLDLVTEQFGGPTMRATNQAAMNGCERLDSRGRIRIRVSTRSQDIVRDAAEGVLRWWLFAPYRAAERTLLAAAVKDAGRRKTSSVVSALVGHGADANVPWW
jgi:hypothetical protein